MQVVKVRGADGSLADLALVRVVGEHVHVCPFDRVKQVENGNEESVVVFPVSDVKLPEDAAR